MVYQAMQVTKARITASYELACWTAGKNVSSCHDAQRQKKQMAEREGFEPSEHLMSIHTLSKRAPSTTRPPLRWAHNCTKYWAGHVKKKRCFAAYSALNTASDSASVAVR